MSTVPLKYDYIIIGAGVSGLALASQIPVDASTLIISSPKLLPPSSFSAGALVSTYGAQSGMSPLGDIICEAFDEFQNWAKKNSHMNGLTAIDIEYICPKEQSLKNLEKFRHRWSKKKIESSPNFLIVKDQGYIIEPPIFLNHLKNNIGKIKMKDGFVSSIDSVENLIVLNNDEKIQYKKLILATGGYEFLHQEVILKENIKKQKISYGAYLISTQENLGDRPFVYNFNNMNIIYNLQKELVIGATTQDNSHFVTDLNYFEESIFTVKKLFKKLNLKNPSFKNTHIKSGIRSKGPKRMPTMEWVNDDIFICHHLYKNGFLFSPLAAKKFSDRLY